ncbi:MAG: hypothetical protein Q8O33_04790 [Pseudomonadota bacterium]|nr:hypothetical protein [Pseudomonadota bacterium]
MTPLPLVIETQASVTAKGLLIALHLAALAALLLASLPTSLHLGGIALLGASLWKDWRRPVALRLRGKADGKLECWRDSAWKPLELRPDSVVLAGLIVLRWREDGRRHSLALPPDALPGDDHRRLRVWLRWKAAALL